MKKKIVLIIFTALALTFAAAAFCYAAEGEPALEYTEIKTVEDFKNISRNPEGNYILTCDLDFEGVEWTSFAFYGILNGDGYSILNLTVRDSVDTALVYDANLKEYEARVGGLFSVLDGAKIVNLNLRNESVSFGENGSDESMFLGLLAGYAYDARIYNCSMDGRVFAKTSGHCFGTGGVFGFAGYSGIEDCDVDAELICIDTDKEYKDEQFMGGAFAFGYCDVLGCNIRLYGYDSDHGYVHDGGIVGCFMYYDGEHVGEISMKNNSVIGRIKFFEDNRDRRAYCGQFYGEIMNWNFGWGGNTADFVRDEVYDYSVDLMPEIDWEGRLIGKTDIMLITSHADDEQLFFAGVLPYYTKVRNLAVQVVYATDHIESTGRNQERERGLYAVGVTARPDFLGLPDQYSESLDGALANFRRAGFSEDDIIEMLREMLLKYRPKVVVTHDVNGEYRHGQHICMNSCLRKCLEKYSDEFDFLEKVYFHLYDENKIELSVIDESFDELDGLTPFQVTQQYGFAEHKSQHWTWFYGWLYGKNGKTVTKASEITTYSPLYYGLYYGDSSKDENRNDFFEGLKSYETEEQERIAKELEEKRLEEERLAREEAERKAEEERLKKAAERRKILVAIAIAVAVIFVIFKSVSSRKE